VDLGITRMWFLIKAMRIIELAKEGTQHGIKEIENC
jgi:hypothetical protein